ncbi:helix-turn-helix domain-containing protein [Arsenicibacter rosenii]|uniref:HTH cro/C1-type domain-containing protein n=1 Tax=Arsenicibacter rosenii TaxID=1750698 RepID=A0A1S2VHI8_9BACT|nr:helix-turn-helix domain-containing protein [Arsenicibacter rosenii]OIN57705.1 hypothetical protein BLX24_18335 [Arsenicibacter rosenii]
MTYGTRLLHFRQKSGFTQTQIAEKLNIAVSTYNAWEADRSHYKIEMLLRLADLFQVSPLDLIPEKAAVMPNHDSPTDLSPLTIEAHLLYTELVQSLKQVSFLKDAEIERLRQQIRQKDTELAQLRQQAGFTLPHEGIAAL